MHEKEITFTITEMHWKIKNAHNKYNAPAGMTMSNGLAERGVQTFKHGMTHLKEGSCKTRIS